MDQLCALARTLLIEAHAVWLTARHADAPWLARLLGMVIAAYALSPIDFIPDFIPILGVLDEAVLIPLGIWLFLKLVPDQLYAENRAIAAQAAERPISWAGAAAIAALWIGLITLAALLLLA